MAIAQNPEINFHSFSLPLIDGKEFSFAELKGKKVLVVNVASKCGFTPQYAGLQEIYEKYKDKNFEILAFPSNDFGGQEPGTSEDIVEFCKSNYGVTFRIFEKVNIKGDNVHPLYQWLTKMQFNGVSDNEVKWNFQKYLIDEEGRFVAVYKSSVKPDDKEITGWILNDPAK